MADEASSLAIDYKNLHELRVIDLKKELEKRGLSKSGSKKELVDRLKTQLKIEELREKSKTGSEGAQVPSIQLSEGGQNEFVKSYLQQREKLFEQQMEQKKKYEEEASRSQESESQSETDDGAKTEKMGSGEPAKLLPRANQSFQKTKEDAEETENVEMVEEDRRKRRATDDVAAKNVEKEAIIELRRRPRSHSGSSRSRSSSSSTSSPSRERSKSGSRASRSRSPSVEEIPPEEFVGKSQPSSSPIPPRKKLRRSRSNSSSGSVSEAEEKKTPTSAEPKSCTGDPGKGHSDSESGDRSLPEQKKPRSRPASSSSSAAIPGAQLPVEETKETKEHQRRLSRTSSGSSTDVEEIRQPGVDLQKPSSSQEFKDDKMDLEERPVVVASDDVIDIVLEAGADKENEDKLNLASKELPSGTSGADEKQKHNDQAPLEAENGKNVLKDEVTVPRSEIENEGKPEESEIRPTRKRRWGSTTLKTISNQPSTHISTESLKALIPEMKVDIVLTEVLPELENPSPDEQNHKDLQLTEAVEDKEKGQSDNQKDSLAAKRKVVYINQEPTKQKSQESAKLSRTIFQAVKPGDESGNQDLEKAVDEAVVLQPVDESDILMEPVEKKNSEKQNESVLPEKKIEARRISRPPVPLIPVDDPQPVGRRSPSPARNSATNIVHIHRLVRPYTLGQLKELLSQSGTIADDGFWIDKIKSHCLVVYSTVEEATASRRFLHGKRWPLSNPNILRVEYSTQEEFDMFKNAKDGVIPTRPVVKPEEVPEKKHEQETRPVEHVKEHERDKKEPPARPSARDGRPRAKERSPPVREWDRDKIRQSRSRSRDRGRREDRAAERGIRPGGGDVQGKDQSRDKSREERRKRRAASQERKDKKGTEKVETEPPAKLLDDLFRKTKAVPCIYWLPLTEEQISQKLAVQQQAEAERERRRVEREQQQAVEEPRAGKEERAAKENRREDRPPDRRDRTSDGRQRDPSDSGMAAGGLGGRGDRTASRR